MARYLMRFDDINSEMNWENFFLLKKKLEQYNIKSILGVIPNCKDEYLSVSKKYKKYYDYLKSCKAYGDIISQHGYQHIFDSKNKGEFGSSKNSEFAGHPFDIQYSRLLKGKNILKKNSIWDPVFMAPSHSFDENTVLALKKLKFDTILDGFALNPFIRDKIKFVPQISSKPLPTILPLVSQLCIHVNTISDNEITKLLKFIDKNHNLFISLEEIKFMNKIFSYIERFLVFYLIKIYKLIKKNISFFINIYFKILCILQRLIYRIKYRNIVSFKWHLDGTFYCRKYKMLSLNLINNLKPKLYIDLGCGIGEILSRVNLNANYKLGYDIDFSLEKYYKKYKEKNYKFFTNEKLLFKYIKSVKLPKDDLVVLSMLGYVHQVNPKKLTKILEKYYKNIGKFILVIDNIKNTSNVYQYDHHDLFFKKYKLIKFIPKVDQLRSLYCIQIG